MKITERRLRSIIRSVIRESRDTMSDFELGQAGMKRYKKRQDRTDALLNYHANLGDHPDYDPAEGGDPSEMLFNISGEEGRPRDMVPYPTHTKVSKQLMDSARANSYLQKYSPLKSRIQGKVKCKSCNETFGQTEYIWCCKNISLRQEDGQVVPVEVYMSYDGDMQVVYK